MEGTAEGIVVFMGRCPIELNLSLALGDLIDCQCHLGILTNLDGVTALASSLFTPKV